MSDAIEHLASTDPIIAYRAWQVTGGLLGSVATGSAGWPRCRPMRAVCPIVNAAAEYHTAPGEDCACGLYAMKTVEALAKTLHYGPQIIGRVALWGEIIEHDDGYRAEYAYPQVLFYDDKAFTKSAALAVASAYGCEVAPMPKELADQVPTQVQVQHGIGTIPYAASPHSPYYSAHISIPYQNALAQQQGMTNQNMGQQGAAQNQALIQHLLAAHSVQSAYAQQNAAINQATLAYRPPPSKDPYDEIHRQRVRTNITLLALSAAFLLLSMARFAFALGGH